MCPEVNKFEQAFSDGHQMSLAGGGVPCTVRSHFLGVWGVGGWMSLCNEVSCLEGAGGGAVH